MRTAICFSGLGRSIIHTHENLKTHLIEPMGDDVDVFVFMQNNENVERVKDLLEPRLLATGDDIQHNLNAFKFHPGARRRQEYLNMNRQRQQLGWYLRQYSASLGVIYDRVVFSRLDVKYFVPIEADYFDLDKINIPDFHNFSSVMGAGLNDRFAVGNQTNMLTYFDLYDYIVKEQDQGHPIHGESTLYRYLASRVIGVDHVPVRFTRVRSSGEEIDIRLNVPRNMWAWIDK